MIANNRGSKRLVGTGSLSYRMPAVTETFGSTGYSSSVEQQPLKLCVAGSNPAIQPTDNW